MIAHTPNLTDRDVLHHAQTHLRTHLPLHADGYSCTTDNLLHVLLGVAVNRATIEALCADLLGTRDPKTIRHYLNAQLRVDVLPALEDHINAALADALPAPVWAHARDVAIDVHDRPYSGKASHADGLWVRGEAHDRTTRFYRVDTASLMLNGLRITLALRFILPDDDTVAVLDHLLGRLATLKLRVKRLFLDTGFAGTAVLAYLTQRRQLAVIACPIRGKTGGTRALCRGRSRYRTTHTCTAGDKRRFTAEVAIC